MKGQQRPRKQAKLLAFFKPEHPDAHKPVLDKKPALRGKPVSEAMKEALREVGLEHALQLKEAEQATLVKAARKRARGGRPRGSAKPRSTERPVALQLKLAKSMEDQVSGFSDLEEFFIAQSKRLGMSRREVKQL